MDTEQPVSAKRVGVEVKTGDTCWKDKAEENEDGRGRWQLAAGKETGWEQLPSTGHGPDQKAVLYHS